MYKVVLTGLNWPEPDSIGPNQTSAASFSCLGSMQASGRRDDVPQHDMFVVLWNNSASLLKPAPARDSLAFFSDKWSKAKTNLSQNNRQDAPAPPLTCPAEPFTAVTFAAREETEVKGHGSVSAVRRTSDRPRTLFTCGEHENGSVMEPSACNSSDEEDKLSGRVGLRLRSELQLWVLDPGSLVDPCPGLAATRTHGRSSASFTKLAHSRR